MADPFVCVRQRAGAFVKAFSTDRACFVRRSKDSKGLIRKRAGPAMCRTSVDKLELRLALFGYDGVFYTLTFASEHLPADLDGVQAVWDAFLKRLARWNRRMGRGGSPDFYVYRIEGLHGDHRYHIHAFLRDSDFPPTVVRYLWDWGEVDDEPWDRKRVLAEKGYVHGGHGLSPRRGGDGAGDRLPPPAPVQRLRQRAGAGRMGQPGRPGRGQRRFRQPGLPAEAEPAEADGANRVRFGHRAGWRRGMNRAYLKSVYEAVRDLVDLTVRQRELFEAWLYTERTFAQLAIRYGVNRSTVFRTVERAAQYVERTAKRLDIFHKARTR